jgi:hypothetical protein
MLRHLYKTPCKYVLDFRCDQFLTHAIEQFLAQLLPIFNQGGHGFWASYLGLLTSTWKICPLHASMPL